MLTRIRGLTELLGANALVGFTLELEPDAVHGEIKGLRLTALGTATLLAPLFE